MPHYKDTPRSRQADGQEALFADRVIRIGKCRRERVIEDCASFVKVDAVLPEIGGSLLRVPLEDHSGSLLRILLSACRPLRSAASGQRLRRARPLHLIVELSRYAAEA